MTCAWSSIWPIESRCSTRAASSPKARQRRSLPTRPYRPPIWVTLHERRTDRRRAAYLLRQEPYPAWREPEGCGRPDHGTARSQWSRQDYDLAYPRGFDARTRGACDDFRGGYHALADLPDRRERRRLRARGAKNLR